MNTNRIDGIIFEAMLKNGLINLCNSEKEINDLNVFPVADGDTGTNMRFTIENGMRYARSSANLGAYLKTLSDGMLLGARGNSGVILSQIFKGIAQSLTRYSSANAAEFRNSLIKGYRAAYSTVVCPVEGTILTVTREGIEHIKDQIGRNTTIETLLAMYIAEMKKTLALTPQMLDVLKESEVVDSGAFGFIIIVEGMLKQLNGETLKLSDNKNVSVDKDNSAGNIDFSKFTADSEFIDGYCTEFILQLMNASEYDHEFSLEQYTESLKGMGESLVVTQAETRVKVHIHTKRPSNVIEYSQRFGEFLTFKMENMQLQHNEQIAKKAKKERKPAKHKPISFVCVVNGEGMSKILTESGCDYIIEANSSMNVSSEEFLEAYKYLDADKIVVLPNNKNTVMAARQAIELNDDSPDKIVVIPTSSVVEGYYVMGMDMPDNEIDYRISELEQGLGFATVIEQTVASKDYSGAGLDVKAGDQIALIDGEVAATGEDTIAAIVEAMKLVEDIEDKEFVRVFRGNSMSEEDGELLYERILENFDWLDVLVLDGGQDVYNWMLGIV